MCACMCGLYSSNLLCFGRLFRKVDGYVKTQMRNPAAGLVSKVSIMAALHHTTHSTDAQSAAGLVSKDVMSVSITSSWRISVGAIHPPV